MAKPVILITALQLFTKAPLFTRESVIGRVSSIQWIFDDSKMVIRIKWLQTSDRENFSFFGFKLSIVKLCPYDAIATM